MKARTHTLSLGLVAALVGAAVFSAPQAQAGHDRSYTVAGRLFGSVARGRDDHRGRAVIQAPANHCRPRPVVVHRPVVTHRPVVVHRPVVAHRPVVVHRPPHRSIFSLRWWGHRKPVVTHCTKRCCKPVMTYHPAPQKRRRGNGCRQPGGHSQDDRGGRQGRGRR
ncbi:MAG: hypothetical protein HN849_01900 [Victivallales bacterium]|nr:hypothetical protein [Victivallales bacterium]